jgi:tetratricopeptide (TPR) repeat protein
MEDKTLAKQHFMKGLAYYFEGSPKVFNEARKAVELHPKWSRPHWLMGTAYLFVPPINVEAAIREFREVVRKEPLWAEGHLNLGHALEMQGRSDEALKRLSQSANSQLGGKLLLSCATGDYHLR